LDLNGKQVATPLKSWEDLGTQSFAGPATYRKQFTASAAPAGKRLFLEIADVHDYARVKLNGKELEAHAWQPYRWEVTNVVKPGANESRSGSARDRGRPRGSRGSASGRRASAPAAGGRGGRGGRAQGAASRASACCGSRGGWQGPRRRAAAGVGLARAGAPGAR